MEMAPSGPAVEDEPEGGGQLRPHASLPPTAGRRPPKPHGVGQGLPGRESRPRAPCSPSCHQASAVRESTGRLGSRAWAKRLLLAPWFKWSPHHHLDPSILARPSSAVLKAPPARSCHGRTPEPAQPESWRRLFFQPVLHGEGPGLGEFLVGISAALVVGVAVDLHQGAARHHQISKGAPTLGWSAE